MAGTEYLDVWVKPGSRRQGVGGAHGGRVIVAVTAKPIDGSANRAVARAVAEHLGIPARRVVVHRGGRSRRKTLQILEVDADLANRLAQLLITVEQ